MSEAGAGPIRMRALLSGTAILLALAACFAWSGLASAAGPARVGSTFATSFLTLPAGATPGGDSGFGEYSPERSAVSADGRYITFVSAANSLSRAANPNVVNIFRKDRQTGAVELVSRNTGKNGVAPTQNSRDPRISADGNIVAFLTRAPLVPEDVDGVEDVYLRNLTTGVTTLATPNTTGTVFQHDLSGDGQFIAFVSPEALVGGDLNGQPDVYRRNLGSGVINLVSRIHVAEMSGIGYADSPSISGDGRWVAFRSDALNLLIVPTTDGNGVAPDVFVRDIDGATSFLVSSEAGNLNKGGNGESGEPAIAGTPAGSAELKVAYGSYSTNVAAGGIDASNASSVYLRSSLAAAPSTLISQSTGGANADSRAHTPTISDNGNLVFFSSDADNLGAGDDYYGAYLRDIGAATTVLGSARNEYAIAGDISGNGNLIAWTETGGATADSDPDAYGVFIRPIPGGTVQFVSRPKGKRPFLKAGAYADSPGEGTTRISSNGRYVVSSLFSDRLGTRESGEVFRRDLSNGRLELVSRKSGKSGAKSGGSTLPSISDDGNRVAFVSFLSLAPADADGNSDAYVRDLKTKTTTLVSRADGPAGADANQGIESAPLISGDGKRVVFATNSTNLGVPGGSTQVFVRDLAAGKTILVSRAAGPAGVAGNNISGSGGISNNGQFVVFRSLATNLDPDDAEGSPDIYVRNLATDSLVLVSREPGLSGSVSPQFEYYSAISGDGKVVAFATENDALAPGSGPWPPGYSQIISRVVATGANSVVSRTAGGAIGNKGSSWPSMNRDGSVIAFETQSDNLLPGRGGENRTAVLVRNTKDGRLSGPPAFGLVDNQPQQGAMAPSITDSGQCVSFRASGHNRVSDDLSDIPSTYVYVATGTCTNPRGIPKPKLSGVRVGASTISFRLNTKATVRITFQRKKAGGFTPAGKVVRKNQKAGKRSFRYRGKVGKRKLRPGSYRVTLVAKNTSGSSRKIRKNLRVRGT